MQAVSMVSYELTAWMRGRLLRLMQDGASVHPAKGYSDNAAGREPDHEKVVSNPFTAKHYHEGYDLAAYELGNARSTLEEVSL